MRPSPMVDSENLDWSKLRTSLESGHEMILDQIFKCRTGGKLQKNLEQFRNLEQIVLAHLSSQSPRFYQALEEHLRNEKSQLKILEYLIFDLKDLKIKLLIFMDAPAATFYEFKNDLTIRVSIEKERLIPLIESIITPHKKVTCL